MNKKDDKPLSPEERRRISSQYTIAPCLLYTSPSPRDTG